MADVLGQPLRLNEAADASAMGAAVTAALDKLRGAVHPLVNLNPVTGRRSLYLASHASRINELSLPEGRLLLRELQTDPLLAELRAARLDAGLLALPIAGDDLETLRNMVAAGVGATLLPQLAAAGAQSRRDVEIVGLVPEPSRRVALLWRKAYARVESAQALSQHLLAHLPEGVSKC